MKVSKKIGQSNLIRKDNIQINGMSCAYIFEVNLIWREFNTFYSCGFVHCTGSARKHIFKYFSRSCQYNNNIGWIFLNFTNEQFAYSFMYNLYRQRTRYYICTVSDAYSLHGHEPFEDTLQMSCYTTIELHIVWRLSEII